jgi:hypothetical protein
MFARHALRWTRRSRRLLTFLNSHGPGDVTDWLQLRDRRVVLEPAADGLLGLAVRAGIAPTHVAQ